MQDASDEFNAIHSTKAKNMLDDYYIGELDADADLLAGGPSRLLSMPLLALNRKQMVTD